MKRLALLISTVALASLTLAAPVLAAAPGNDTYASRTVIGALPFSESIDTTEATTDAADADLNAQCGAPAVDASVWYELTASSDAALLIDLSGSTYAAGVIVAVRAPGSLTVIACGPGGSFLYPSAGETYTILVFDFDSTDGANGGQLNITVGELPPPPVLDVTIDAAGGFNARTGVAIIRGTVTCTGGTGDDKTYIDVQATQAIGRLKFTGQGSAGFVCDGATHAWMAEVASPNGKFAGGKASVTLFAFVCTAGGCDDATAERTVTLKK